MGGVMEKAQGPAQKVKYTHFYRETLRGKILIFFMKNIFKPGTLALF